MDEETHEMPVSLPAGRYTPKQKREPVAKDEDSFLEGEHHDQNEEDEMVASRGVHSSTSAALDRKSQRAPPQLKARFKSHLNKGSEAIKESMR